MFHEELLHATLNIVSVTRKRNWKTTPALATNDMPNIDDDDDNSNADDCSDTSLVDEVDFDQSQEPTSFLQILAERKKIEESERVEVATFVPVFTEAPVVDKEVDCSAPHMCSHCWVNDHMYCVSMKRNPHDIRPIGDCTHFRLVHSTTSVIIIVATVYSVLPFAARANMW